MKKTALITGATSGLGKAIADYYRRKQYRVYDVSRAGYFAYNLADQAELHDFVPTFKTRLDSDESDGGLTVLINNAGALFLNEGVNNVNHLYNLLLYTPYVLMTRFGDRLVGGHIINIASVSGTMADPDTPMYGALKAGIISLTKSFALKFAPLVRVNCISPGFFNTNLVPGEVPAQLLEPVPLMREAKPDEILSVIEMLDTTPYMTGANIVIDGGLIA